VTRRRSHVLSDAFIGVLSVLARRFHDAVNADAPSASVPR
jgi:hypothetical protein